VRITLPDRPGTLAVLAKECGLAGVNIMGLQVFPGIEAVTDELILSVPNDWRSPDISDLMERAGGTYVGGNPCNEGSLVDQPTRFVQAARSIVAQPARFPEVVAVLFDAEADPEFTSVGEFDHMELSVGDVQVQIHRRAPFTATEHARGVAMAELVSDVIQGRRVPAIAPPQPGRRLGTGVTPTFVNASHSVTAVVEDTPVARAVLAELVDPGVRRLALEVDPAWRRRGIGSRLLVEAARLAAGLGDEELVITTGADNQAVLPLVLGSGLRGRIRLAGDHLTVRVPLRDLTPVSL
jgi:GNAT superfamily N-acetyltransferase